MNKYAVIRINGFMGFNDIAAIGYYDTKEEAQAEAKFRRSCLSPYEKKCYGIKYKVVRL